MCTAISYSGCRHYFGRNLDLDRSWGESVTVTPRHAPFRFRMAGEMPTHYAMIGMAAVVEDYPLYFEATNERGLSMAGLNFPLSARYFPPAAGKDNVAPFELIPWILGRCATVQQARPLLDRLNLVRIDFRPDFPLTPLHWLLSDARESVVIESTRQGLRVFDAPLGVLTNEPPFPQLPCPDREAAALPGDWSSTSRYRRAVYVKQHLVPEEGPGSFFHLLDSVAVPRGPVRTDTGRCHFTRYSSCCDTAAGVYYYTTYENRTIRALDLHSFDPEGARLICRET